jgi:hypothetical protein
MNKKFTKNQSKFLHSLSEQEIYKALGAGISIFVEAYKEAYKKGNVYIMGDVFCL